MTVDTDPRVMRPRAVITVDEGVMDEVWQPNVVEEEGVRFVEGQLSTGGTSRDHELPVGRSLQLKFLDQVSGPVQTGNVLRGMNDECLRLALVDSDEQIVDCGPAKAEIVLLLDDDGNGMITHENFKTRIIKTGEKKRPHFAKPVFVSLKEGGGDLSGVKLGQDSGWTNSCYCRLGATLVQPLGGTAVRDAWTLPFKVEDNRKTRNKKHHPPLLQSEVWRLERIGRNGEPCKRLEERSVETVQDFLFWYYVNPKELKKTLRLGYIPWKAIVTHAKTCIIDDQRMYSHRSSNEPQTSVVYDAVGRLKGLIKEECHFVAIDNLSADEKGRARELLVSVLEGPAFGERYGIPFNMEPSGITNAPVQQWPNGCSRLTFSDNANIPFPANVLGPANVPFPDPELTNLESHCYPISSLPAEEDKGNADPLEDMDRYLLMAGETSSRPSNASFCSLDSTMEIHNLCGDDDDLYWGTNDWLSQGPPSPNSLHYYAADHTASYKDRTYDYGIEPRSPQPQVVSTSGNEPCADASGQPQPQDVGTGGNEAGADVSTQSQPQPQPRPWPQDVSTSGSEPHPMFHYIEEDPLPQYGAYAEPHVIFSTRDGPKGWKFVKFVVCLPKWWFSITMRVPQVTRKRKLQRAALQQSSRVWSCPRTV